MPEGASTGEIVAQVIAHLPVDKVYSDLIAPPAQAVGTGLSEVIKLLFLPAQVLNILGQSKVQSLESELAERAKKIPADRLQQPPLYISGPVVQSMAFSEDAPELRKLYMNLLLKAMDSETVREAHPAYTEVIKQLSPDEARIVSLVKAETGFPAVTVRSFLNRTAVAHSEYNDILRLYSGLAVKSDCEYPEMESLYIDNLTRLGFFTVSPTESLTGTGIYEEIFAHQEVQEAMVFAQQLTDRETHVVRRLIVVTEFARRFYQACVASDEQSA